jgi:two-component system chemotaxis response regulator CheY
MAANTLPKIMIVDDEPFFRALLRDILEREGFSVAVEAVNGEDAVEKYREHRPDVTIMDIFMPVKHGIDATMEILAFDGSARILVCSAVGFDDEIQAALAAGARYLILKPFMAEEIVEAINKVMADG